MFITVWHLLLGRQPACKCTDNHTVSQTTTKCFYHVQTEENIFLELEYCTVISHAQSVLGIRPTISCITLLASGEGRDDKVNILINDCLFLANLWMTWLRCAPIYTTGSVADIKAERMESIRAALRPASTETPKDLITLMLAHSHSWLWLNALSILRVRTKVFFLRD